MRRILCCALLFLPTWFFCPGTITLARAAPPIIVSGVVRWSEARDPAANIIVSIYPEGDVSGQPAATTRSVVNGSFILKVPSPGQYRIGTTPDLPVSVVYHPLTVPADGVDGITLLVSERFRPRGAYSLSSVHLIQEPPIKLEVTDAKGQPVQRGIVQVWIAEGIRHPEGSPYSGVWQNSSGRWIQFDAGHDKMILNSPLFRYEPAVTRVGITVRSAVYGGGQVLLDRWPDAPVKIRLHPTPDLTGKVIDANGYAVRGANVLVSGIAPELPFRFLQGWAWATTDETGHFHIPTLFPGRYGVQVCMPPGEPGRVQYVTIPGVELRSANFPASGEGAAPVNGSAQSGPPAGAVIALRRPQKAVQIYSRLYAFGINEAQPIPNPMENHLPTLRGSPPQPVQAGMGFGDETLETPPPDTPIKIEGHLKLSPSGAPIPNCMVQLFQDPQDKQYTDRRDNYPVDVTTTAPDGSFSLTALRPGSYHLEIDQFKYVPRDRPLDIIENRLAPVSLMVVSHPVANILVVGTDGKPLVGKPIKVWVITPRDFDFTGVRMADNEPIELRWRAQTLPIAGEELKFEARSATVGVGMVQMDEWPAKTVTIRLAPGATLRCQVLDAAGKPVPNATVNIDDQFGQRIAGPDPIYPVDPLTDKNGSVQFINLSPGAYSVDILGPGVFFNRKVTVNAPETSVILKPDPNPVAVHH